MMKYLVVLLVVAFTVLGCKEEVIEEPENLIPENKMTELLYDLAVLNGAKATNPGILKDNDIETMPYLFNKYKIDSLQFVQSDVYYASKPLIYQRMYKEVLSRLETKADKMEEDRKRKADSIKEANKKVKDTLAPKVLKSDTSTD
ncbi:DUF4296 domain-containing protein [Croceivirga radicis]|nr:DUF4296 domain-containing protein [Croceivirga radicis]